MKLKQLSALLCLLVFCLPMIISASPDVYSTLHTYDLKPYVIGSRSFEKVTFAEEPYPLEVQAQYKTWWAINPPPPDFPYYYSVITLSNSSVVRFVVFREDVELGRAYGMLNTIYELEFYINDSADTVHIQIKEANTGQIILDIIHSDCSALSIIHIDSEALLVDQRPGEENIKTQMYGKTCLAEVNFGGQWYPFGEYLKQHVERWDSPYTEITVTESADGKFFEDWMISYP